MEGKYELWVLNKGTRSFEIAEETYPALSDAYIEGSRRIHARKNPDLVYLVRNTITGDVVSIRFKERS